MTPSPRTTIAVHPAAAHATRPRLFGALEAIFPVAFRPWAADDRISEALIVIGDAASLPGEVAFARPTLVVAAGALETGPAEIVRVADSHWVDRRLRGIELTYRAVGSPLTSDPDGDDVLAAAPSGAVWTRSRGSVPLERVRAPLPELAPDELLTALLWQHGMAAVALVQFLRSLRGHPAQPARPVRAAFVFDDPNLRWHSYGYIDYRRLIEHADAHGYHASMAMIPLDAGRPHPAAAAIFARRRDRLSLVVHGNDHLKRELFRPRDPDSALALAAQAMRRIEGFERRSGVRVDRVMMPPHGMCTENVARALAAVGFDALCTIHPIPWTGHPPATEPLAGWRPAEFVAGCAVIPRVHLATSTAEIALRAFLDHPIVIYGHHEDLADGLEPLAEAAARVNRLGEVSWTSVGEIALGNHAQEVVADRLEVRPYARRVRVRVAPRSGTRTLSVVAPQHAGSALELHGWSVGSGPVRRFGADLPISDERSLEVRLHGSDDVDPNGVAAPSWRAWPRLRRLLTELRDRALPLRPGHAR